MKKLVLVLLALTLTVGVFAGGQEEKPQITVLHAPEGPPFSVTQYATEKLKADFPDVEVVLMQVDLSDGSTLTMDAMLAAGTPPNVYIDYIGRASKYIVGEYALALNDRVRDIDQYQEGILEPYTRNGFIYGLPAPGSAQGMAINLEIMDEIGYEVPWNWTIDDFLEMAELVKQHYNGEKWATGMFAANQSGDYLINNWFAAFGADWYGSDYADVTIASIEGERTYQFIQTLVVNGYVPPGAATLTDDDYVIQWAKGDIAATAFFPNWTAPYFTTVIEQGLRDEPFDYIFVPFPHASDKPPTPTYVSTAALVVHQTDTPEDDWAARWAEYYNDAYVQSQMSMLGVIPNRVDAEMLTDDPRVAETARIAQENGVMDVGLTMPFFARTRPQHYPVLQKVLNLDLTPSEAIVEYAVRLEEALVE